MQGWLRYILRHSCHEKGRKFCRPQSYMYRIIIGLYTPFNANRQDRTIGYTTSIFDSIAKCERKKKNNEQKITWLMFSWWCVRSRGVAGFGCVAAEAAPVWCCCCCSTTSWWWWWLWLSSFNLAVSDWWCLSASQSLLTSQQVSTDYDKTIG